RARRQRICVSSLTTPKALAGLWPLRHPVATRRLGPADWHKPLGHRRGGSHTRLHDVKTNFEIGSDQMEHAGGRAATGGYRPSAETASGMPPWYSVGWTVSSVTSRYRSPR